MKMPMVIKFKCNLIRLFISNHWPVSVEIGILIVIDYWCMKTGHAENLHSTTTLWQNLSLLICRCYELLFYPLSQLISYLFICIFNFVTSFNDVVVSNLVVSVDWIIVKEIVLSLTIKYCCLLEHWLFRNTVHQASITRQRIDTSIASFKIDPTLLHSL